jgi:hypothetical protein
LWLVGIRVHRVTVVLDGVGTRRVIDVPDTFTLADLHDVVVAAMGWSGARAHRWLVDGDTLDDAREATWLAGALVGRPARYVYGEGWTHTVSVAPGRRPSALPYPLLLSAELACPPEDYDGPAALPADLDLSRAGLRSATERVAALQPPA